MPGSLIVLAGTNGAGKSSVAGAALRAFGGDYYNPDEVSRRIGANNPRLTREEANSLAWHANLDALKAAIAEGRDYAFETTLGGRTIPRTIASAAASGMAVRVWYVGLASVDLHLRRIAARVAAGGHPIAADKVRERYSSSLRNMVALMPLLAELRVFDNSAETLLVPGAQVAPQLVLHVLQGTVKFPLVPADLRATPVWAQPLVAKAFER
jgi:predicted ABC-type ATPase